MAIHIIPVTNGIVRLSGFFKYTIAYHTLEMNHIHPTIPASLVGQNIVAIHKSGKNTTEISIVFIWALFAIVTSFDCFASRTLHFVFLLASQTLYAR